MREKPLVLVVDDEEVFLEIVSVKLQEEGLATVTTRDVRDALAKAELLLPDLVLSDIYMPPGPSGWELAIALRENPKTRAIKFAFFSSLRDPWAELMEEKKSFIEKFGQPVFFSKTDDVQEIVRRISKLIQ